MAEKFTDKEQRKLNYIFDLVETQYERLVLFAPATNCATGDNAAYLDIPPNLNGMDLSYVHARNATAGITGTMDIQLRKNASTDMLSTVITIDTTETGSDTAAVPAVIKSDGSEAVATNDVIHADVDAIHSGTAPIGCIVTIGFKNPE